jgi:hypothetical protein
MQRRRCFLPLVVTGHYGRLVSLSFDLDEGAEDESAMVASRKKSKKDPGRSKDRDRDLSLSAEDLDVAGTKDGRYAEEEMSSSETLPDATASAG